MRFCPKCHSVLIPVKSLTESYLVCMKCGYSMKISDGLLEEYKYTINIFKKIRTSKPIEGYREDKYKEILELLREETREIRDKILSEQL